MKLSDFGVDPVDVSERHRLVAMAKARMDEMGPDIDRVVSKIKNEELGLFIIALSKITISLSEQIAHDTCNGDYHSDATKIFIEQKNAVIHFFLTCLDTEIAIRTHEIIKEG